MSFTLENIVPWGRSYTEYVEMFGFTESDLQGRILGCGDGPAAFNARLTKHRGKVISVDPLYRFSAEEIRARIDATFDKVMQQAIQNKDDFVWEKIKTVEALGQLRMAAMDDFLADYPRGIEQQRYLDDELPNLPFMEGGFDLALCSHLLFLYSAQLSTSFHIESIKTLCRLAREVRIFPLLELGGKLSRHLQQVTASLTQEGYMVEIIPVAYEFQRGAKEMMKVSLFKPK